MPTILTLLGFQEVGDEGCAEIRELRPGDEP